MGCKGDILMNKYVEIIKKTLDQLIPLSSPLHEEDALNIIAAVELAIKIIRVNSSVSDYTDFVRTIGVAMDKSEGISEMAESMYEYDRKTRES